MVEPLRVTVVGWGAGTIMGFWDRLHDDSTLQLSHIIASPREFERLRDLRGLERIQNVRDDRSFLDILVPDPALLASLEHDSVPTVHNMILGDRVVRHLPYGDALLYASRLAWAFERFFQTLKPSVVIGSFDNLHSGVSLAVARKLGVPWFSLQHPPIPFGLAGFCSGMTPDTVVPMNPLATEQELYQLAENTMQRFQQRNLAVPVYLSSNTLRLLVARLPAHIGEFYAQAQRSLTGRHDRFTEYTLRRLLRQYLRKRLNRFRLPLKWFVNEPPVEPFVFFAFHLQPESSIDVWAPFYANQPALVETISRAIPPTHRLLIKLHKSDADGHSPAALKRLTELPGVQIVSPFADSHAFVQQASLVVAIQGTVAMEAALSGTPVLIFGSSPYTRLAGVHKAGVHEDLPRQIRKILCGGRPDRDAIMRGLISFLSCYVSAIGNVWAQRPTDEEISRCSAMFKLLREHLEAHA